MPTIQMTRSLGALLTQLKQPNRAIAKLRGWSTGLGAHSNDRFQVDDDLVKQLKRLKLIEQRIPDGAPGYWRSWYASQVYVLSDAGKALPLPPEEMWLEDE
jgi:hypothetical protein